jgi:mono/diheme cytochrome c family protein
MLKLHIFAAAAVLAASLSGASTGGDARRGAKLFESEQCVQCHSLNGKGGSSAPDLARTVDRDYTPAVMASLMWNHAPDMWAAMKRSGFKSGGMTPDQAADLFAYFVSVRYFDKPGDAARGKVAFTGHRCDVCHALAASADSPAPPVAKWESLADPVVLAQQMWNHGPKMREAYRSHKLTWSPLTGQELTDMLVYLQNLPETRSVARTFSFPAGAEGEKLFSAKDCNQCHTGKRSLELLLKNQTLTQIAAGMWNHEPEMKSPPPNFTAEEMSQLISYLWARQYFSGSGSASKGKAVFAAKHCATCHNDAVSGAPSLAKGKTGHSDITMVSALWNHGGQMLESMSAKRLAWPRFTAREMEDLIAYLNSL